MSVLIPLASILLIGNIALGTFVFYKSTVEDKTTSGNKALAAKYSNCSGLLNGGYGKTQGKLFGLDKKKNVIKLDVETTMINGTKIKPNGEYTLQDATSSSILKDGQLIDFQGNLVLDQDCSEYLNNLDLTKL
jgi:hypothetical protein